MTQFGRALKALSIEIICANSSQAKGRVERANKTLQDRLVKELRLAGVTAPWRKATPSCRPSRPTTTRASPRHRSTTRTCTGLCRFETSTCSASVEAHECVKFIAQVRPIAELATTASLASHEEPRLS